ncbi:MAG: general secretion pathway protein GspB [Pseudomonadota bacterium]
MSFILDALKRAERERRLERAPDLSAVYEESDLPQRSRWTWFSAAAAFLAGATVVALFLLPKAPPTEVSQSKEPAAEVGSHTPDKERLQLPAGRVQPDKPPLPKDVPQPAGPPAKQVKVVPPVAPVKPTSEETTKAPSTTKPAVSTLPERPADTGTEAGVSEKKVIVSGPPGPTPTKLQDALTPKRVALKETAPLKVPEPMSGRASDVPPAPRSKAEEESFRKSVEAVPLIKDLPHEIQQKLEKLEINVHSYSLDPAECLVFINMRKYRAGDRIGDNGLVLKKIIPEGVIIDYGGGQARLMVR